MCISIIQGTIFIFRCLVTSIVGYVICHSPLIQNAVYFNISQSLICLTLGVCNIFWGGKQMGANDFNVTHTYYSYILYYFPPVFIPPPIILVVMWFCSSSIRGGCIFLVPLMRGLSIWLGLANGIIDITFKLELLHSCLWRITMSRTCFMQFLVQRG